MQVTPEICRELKNSRNRGEKETDHMSIYILYFWHNLITMISVFEYELLLYQLKNSSALSLTLNFLNKLTKMNYLQRFHIGYELRKMSHVRIMLLYIVCMY